MYLEHLGALSGDLPSADDAEPNDRDRQEECAHCPEERDAAEYGSDGRKSRAEPWATIEQPDARDNQYREESQRDEEQRLACTGAVRVRCLNDADRDEKSCCQPAHNPQAFERTHKRRPFGLGFTPPGAAGRSHTGSGGGMVAGGLWLHPDFEAQGLRDRVEGVITGERAGLR